MLGGMCHLRCWLFDEISVVVFEAGASLTVKGKTRKKIVGESIHFRGVNCWNSK